ncbi:MAG: proteasome regulatory particle subunit, partial [Paramarteilia canceri]
MQASKQSFSSMLVKNDPELAKTVRDTIVPQMNSQLTQKNLDLPKVLNLLHEFERKLRLVSIDMTSEDSTTLSFLFKNFVNTIFDIKKYSVSLEQLEYFSKKKHNSRQSLECYVNTVASRVDEISNKKEQVDFMLKFVELTDGKIFAEVERTQIVSKLVEIYESQNELALAHALIIQTHVETYGSLDFSAKTKFLLNQMRLCLACNDYSRLELISKKVNQKFLNELENETHLLTFYDYMVKYHIEQQNFANAGKCFQSLLKCSSVTSDLEKKTK